MRQLSALCCAGALLALAPSALAEEIYAITVGEDVVITDMNVHEKAVEADPQNPGSSAPAATDVLADSSGNTAKVSVTASDDRAAVARATVGVQYDFLPGNQPWDAVKDKPVWVVVKLSYQLDASYTEGDGSANGAIAIRPLVAAPGWYQRVGKEVGEPGAKGAQQLEVGFLSTPEKLGAEIALEAYAQAHAILGEGPHQAGASIEIHSIAFDFTPPPPRRTFTVRLESKLFIDDIGWFDCGNPMTGQLFNLNNPGKRAAFQAFCQATSLGENPPTGAWLEPLDARIRGGVDVQFTCEAGSEVPVGWSGVTPLATNGGWEGPLFKGVANPTTTRDDLTLDGTFAFVTSGHPHPVVELAFQSFELRARPDIWHAFRGRARCGVDASGQPTARIESTLERTAFPSHKVFVRSPAAAQNFDVMYHEPQRLFSDLWRLPPIPAP